MWDNIPEFTSNLSENSFKPRNGGWDWSFYCVCLFFFAIAPQGKIWRIIYPDIHSILSEYISTPGSGGCVENLYIVVVCFLVLIALQVGILEDFSHDALFTTLFSHETAERCAAAQTRIHSLFSSKSVLGTRLTRDKKKQ